MNQRTDPLHNRPRPSATRADTQYGLVRGIVGDAGAVVRPVRGPGRARVVSILLWVGWVTLGFILVAATVRADETCSSPYLARIEGQEEFLYVWTLGVEGLGDGSDKLVVVDVKPGSPSYGKVIHSDSVGGPARGASRRLHR